MVEGDSRLRDQVGELRRQALAIGDGVELDPPAQLGQRRRPHLSGRRFERVSHSPRPVLVTASQAVAERQGQTIEFVPEDLENVSGVVGVDRPGHVTQGGCVEDLGSVRGWRHGRGGEARKG